MGSLRVWLWVAALLVLFASRNAAAQTIDAGVTLVGIPTHSIARDAYRSDTTLNYADCVNDDVIEFSLALLNRGSNALEAWVGTACDDLSNRTTRDSPVCWKVAATLPTTQTPSLPIHLRDILAGYTIPGIFAATGLSQPAPPVGSDACIDTSGIPAARRAEIYFMLVEPSTQAISGTIATWTATFKLLGPPPPLVIAAEAGPGQLKIDFQYPDSQTSDQTTNGYQFYCDPPAGAPAPADVAAGAEAACAASPESTTLIPGSTTVNVANRCGTAGLSATSGLAKGLLNGAPYHVAMAATDTFGNIGPLSTVTCGVPRADDQSATACSFSPRGARCPNGFALALVSLTLSAWQRSRRRARARGAGRRARLQ